MPFTRPARGKVLYNGVLYNEIECGGAGNCLFLSLAWLFRKTGIDGAATHGGLRQTASVQLQDWAAHPGNLSVNFPTMTVPLPNFADSQRLGNLGVWGELACVAAIVEVFANDLMNPQSIRVHVLGPTVNDVVAYRPCDDNPAYPPGFEIHVIHIGLYHYRALWPANDCAAVPDSMQVFKTASQAAQSVTSKTIFASLNRLEGKSDLEGKAASTLDVTSGASLEIHQINVGQGDAAIILILDKDKAPVRSILIDTGEKTGDVKKPEDFNKHPVKRYLDALVKSGRFRPIDVLILSHWDGDHMGACAQFLRHGLDYFNEPFEIYDVGDIGSRDTDFDNYAEALSLLDDSLFQRRKPRPGESILSCLGVQITCVSSAEIGLSPEFDPDEIDDDILGEYDDLARVVKKEDFALFNIKTDAVPMDKLDAYSDIVSPDQEQPGKKNNASLGWTITFGNFTFFTAGDLEDRAEVAVIQSVVVHSGRHICAWKLSHHGSHASTRSGFLYWARPRFGVASCGYQNMHGHPGRALIPRIAELDAATPCMVYMTGDVEADPDNFGVPDNACTFANKGTVMIRVTAAQAADPQHRFHVATRAGSRELTCGGHRSDIDVHIDDHLELAKELSQEKKRKRAASTGRKVKRTAFIEGAAKHWLDGQISALITDGTRPPDVAKWLEANGLTKRYLDLLNKMRMSVKTTVEGDPATWDKERKQREVQDIEEEFSKLQGVQLFLQAVDDRVPK